MTKVISLTTGNVFDRNAQAVKENQIVILEHTFATRWVVYKITHSQWGYTYHVVSIEEPHFDTAELFTPIRKKLGIGWYYNDMHPEFMDAFEVALLVAEAEKKKQAEQNKAEKERTRIEEIKAVGSKRFAEILPENAQAVIVARLKQNESDSQTDYFASSTQRTVILGFSTHKRDIFSEMRKHASNFEQTAYLAEYNADYEHREKYSMGAGYYLGESNYHGWIIEKVSIYTREGMIKEFAYTAGNEDNIHIKKSDNTPPTPPSEKGGTAKVNCTLVEYSAKAVAVFGETRAIKDELSAMGGRFNSRLTFNGKRLAGWIFSKSQEQRLACYFGLD